MRLQLQEQGLPPSVVKAFAAKGISKLYPWQAGAIECGDDGHNLVYCAPTSGMSHARCVAHGIVGVAGAESRPLQGARAWWQMCS